MVTQPEEWSALTDAQKYDRLVRAENSRDNAVYHARELTGAAALERQQQIVAAITGRKGAVHADSRN